MKRSQLIQRIAEVLRENDIRKPVSIPKQVFTITDGEGSSKQFSVKKRDRNVLYTADDVTAVMDALQYVIYEALKAGEEIAAKGFGVLRLIWREPRSVKNVLDGEEVDIAGRFVPRFFAGNDLKRCAQVYAQAVADKKANELPPPEPDEEEED